MLVIGKPRTHQENLKLIAQSMGNTINVDRRLELEEMAMMHDPPECCAANPVTPDRMEWMAAIIGPEDTPYTGGVFYITIKITADYPLKPPMVRFNTKIYHANISSTTGRVCHEVLQEKWSPILTLQHVLAAIVSLLKCPNVAFDEVDGNVSLGDSLAYSADIANLFKSNRDEHDEKAREFTQQFASLDDPPPPPPDPPPPLPDDTALVAWQSSLQLKNITVPMQQWQRKWKTQCSRLCCFTPNCGQQLCVKCRTSLIFPQIEGRKVELATRYLCMTCPCQVADQLRVQDGVSVASTQFCEECFESSKVLHQHASFCRIDADGAHEAVERASDSVAQEATLEIKDLVVIWKRAEGKACVVCCEPFMNKSGGVTPCSPPGCMMGHGISKRDDQRGLVDTGDYYCTDCYMAFLASCGRDKYFGAPPQMCDICQYQIECHQQVERMNKSTAETKQFERARAKQLAQAVGDGDDYDAGGGAAGAGELAAACPPPPYALE
jgi:ubiquitin-conjugating enzyme E2 D/E